jgi:hypothetical protein
MAIREFGLPATLSIVFWLTLMLSAGGLANASDAYVGVFVLIASAIFLVDVFWIFKDDAKNRLVDVICKTDVLNESPRL